MAQASPRAAEIKVVSSPTLARLRTIAVHAGSWSLVDPGVAN